MLLWEVLSAPIGDGNGHSRKDMSSQATRRLPYDKHCAGITKSGRRCRGKARNGSEWCLFHDPELAAKRKRALAAARKDPRKRLTRLPDGYLRKLTTRRAVGEAMDRLYREVRLGLITPEMGNVMFGILTRLLDSGLIRDPAREGAVDRSKAAKLRPKLAELLTRRERAAWRKAVANAPEHVVRGLAGSSDNTTVTTPAPRRTAFQPARADQPIALPAAS